MRQLEQGIDYLGPPSWHDYSTPQIEAIRTHSSYLGVPFDRREGRYGAWFVLWGFRGGGVVGDRFGEGGIAAGGVGVGLDGGAGAVGPARAAAVIAGEVIAGLGSSRVIGDRIASVAHLLLWRQNLGILFWRVHLSYLTTQKGRCRLHEPNRTSFK